MSDKLTKTKIIYCVLTIIELIAIVLTCIICNSSQRTLASYTVLSSKDQIISALNDSKQIYMVVNAPISGRCIDDELKHHSAVQSITDTNLLCVSYQKELLSDQNSSDKWLPAEKAVTIASRDVQLYDDIYMESLDKYIFDGKKMILQTDSADTRYMVRTLSNHDSVSFLAIIGDNTFSIMRSNDLQYDLFVNASADTIINTVENDTIFIVAFSVIIYILSMTTVSIYNNPRYRNN